MMKLLGKMMVLIVLMIPALAEMTVMTEDNFHPFNYKEGNEIKGISADIVKEMLKRMGRNEKVVIAPWEHAYNLLEKKDGIVLFSTVRSQKRENLFKWVGPLGEIKMVFVGRKDYDKRIRSLEDAKQGGTIGLQIKEDYTSQMLASRGFTNVSYLGVNALNIINLYMGKIDLWIGTEYQMYLDARKMNIDPEQLKVVYEIREVNSENQLYIALSKSTPDSVVMEWQQTLDVMKEDGTVQKIRDSYLR